MKTNHKWTTTSVFWVVVFIILVIVWLYPIVFAVTTSFKPLEEVYNNVLGLIPSKPTLDNYRALLTRLNLNRVISNTFIVATGVTVLKLLTSFLAAYGFVYYSFKGKQFLFILFLTTIFAPFTVTMVPNYLLISKMGLYNNILGVILTQIADASGILLITQSLRSIPFSLIEVAKLDNISDFKIMKDIILPLSRSQLTSTGIWFFVNSWNQFIWPSIILKTEDNYTLPMALRVFISSEGGTDFAVIMAISVITMSIPVVLYLIFQRYIVGTFTSSGIK